MAGACALACLLFIPPGSLPAPCNTPWGAVAWLALFCTSALCSKTAETEFSGIRGRVGNDIVKAGLARAVMARAVLTGTVIALLAWCAWRRGVPGSPLNVGTYAAMPFLELFGPYGKAGLFLLFAGLLLARPGLWPGSSTGSFDARMRRLGWCCLLCAVFVPNPMAAFQASAAWTVAGDWLLFWTAAVLLYRLPLPGRWSGPLWPAALCCLAGGGLLLAELHGTAGIFSANGL